MIVSALDITELELDFLVYPIAFPSAILAHPSEFSNYLTYFCIIGMSSSSYLSLNPCI
jgi:hypothetical protein